LSFAEPLPPLMLTLVELDVRAFVTPARTSEAETDTEETPVALTVIGRTFFVAITFCPAPELVTVSVVVPAAVEWPGVSAMNAAVVSNAAAAPVNS